jgi:uncharacterized protein YceH (UPF0502 family)
MMDLTINYNGDYPSAVTVASDAVIQGALIAAQLIIRRAGQDDVFVDFSMMKGLGAGELSVRQLELLDFEVDQSAEQPPFGSPPVMKSIDLSEELHSLREKIARLEARLKALEAT